MPSKSKHFMLRVTDEDGTRRDDYINVLMKKVKAFAVFEVGSETEKQHYHSLHMSQKSTLQDRLKLLEWTGNENHAFKHLYNDDDENWINTLRYLCKGEARGILPIVIVNTLDLSDASITQYHYDYYDKGLIYSDATVPAKKAASKEDARSSFMRKVDYCKDKGLNYTSSIRDIFMVMIDYYAERMQCRPGDFQIKSVVESIYMHFKYERSKHACASSDASAVYDWQMYKNQEFSRIFPSYSI